MELEWKKDAAKVEISQANFSVPVEKRKISTVSPICTYNWHPSKNDSNWSDLCAGVSEFATSCFGQYNKTTTLLILKYLEPVDVISSCLLVCSEWRRRILCSRIWDFFDAKYGILSRVTFNLHRILCDRRSKGRIYLGNYLGADNPEGVTRVAIRKLDMEIANAGYNDGVPTSIMRECAHLQKVRHPGIITFYGALIMNQSLYVVTEYIAHNLYDFLRCKYDETDSIMSCCKTLAQQSISIIRDLLTALDYLHSFGIIHRNLKPENIFIKCNYNYNSEGKTCLNYEGLKIGDFMSSRFVNSQPGNYTPEETKQRDSSWREVRRLLYKAPELLFRCTSYGPKVDIWSLGVILYELTCGRCPFRGSNEIGILWNICATMGFPELDKIGNMSTELYNTWSNVINKWDPIPLEDVVNLVDRRYGGLASEGILCSCLDLGALLKHYDKVGQQEQLDNMATFYRIMGRGPLEMLYAMLNIYSDYRLSASEILKRRNFWVIDVHSSNYKCECLVLSRPCRFLNSQNSQPHTSTYAPSLLEQSSIDEGYTQQLNHNKANNNGITMHPQRAIDTLPLVNDTNEFICLLGDFWMNMVNCLFVIQQRFEMDRVTIHLAIEYMHRYLSGIEAESYNINDIHYTATACIKLADRFNELSQEYYKSSNCDEYAIIANAFLPHVAKRSRRSDALYADDCDFVQLVPQGIVEYEKKILHGIEFNLLEHTLLSRVFYYKSKVRYPDVSCLEYSLMLADMSLHFCRAQKFQTDLRAQVIWLIAVYKYFYENIGIIRQCGLYNSLIESGSNATDEADSCISASSTRTNTQTLGDDAHSDTLCSETIKRFETVNITSGGVALYGKGLLNEPVDLEALEIYNLLSSAFEPIYSDCVANSVSQAVECGAYMEAIANCGIRKLVEIHKIKVAYHQHPAYDYSAKLPVVYLKCLLPRSVHNYLDVIGRHSLLRYFIKMQL